MKKSRTKYENMMQDRIIEDFHFLTMQISMTSQFF